MSDITRTEVNRVVRAARRIDTSTPAEPSRRGAEPGLQADSEIPEQAARLRLAITRTARRLRQSAGSGLGASSVAALATIERRGPADPERARRRRGRSSGRPRPGSSPARGDGLIERAADPADGRCSLISVTPRAGRC